MCIVASLMATQYKTMPSVVLSCVKYAKLLGRILMSDLVVTNLFMSSLPGIILLYLVAPSFTLKVFLHKFVLLKQ